MKIYEYDVDLPLNVERQDFEDFSVISFDTAYEPEIEESRRVYLYSFEPENPWVNLIFIHGIGNGNIPYLLWFAEYFQKYGVQSFFMVLPYHERRAKPNWYGGEPFFSPSPSYCSKRFHEAVRDVRRTLDFIQSQSRLPTSIMGFSFGGMIATISLALDKRLKNGILAFAGGDWRWINWYSPYTRSLRENYAKYSNEYGCKNEQNCIENREKSMQKMGELAEIDDIFSLHPACFHYDPLSYAQFVQQPVLFFQGLFDKIIPHKSSQSLLNNLPHARKIILPCGHKSSYLFRRFIAQKTIRFLKESL